MIPTNIPEMATMLYMMEVNEWGAENLNDKLKKGEQGRGEDYALGKSVKLQTEDDVDK